MKSAQGKCSGRKWDSRPQFHDLRCLMKAQATSNGIPPGNGNVDDKRESSLCVSLTDNELS